MKVKELIDELDNCKKEYGKDFLNWDIYVEWIDAYRNGKFQKKEFEKRKKNGWKFVKDGDNWYYINQAGYNTKMPKDKIFTVNVNF